MTLRDTNIPISLTTGHEDPVQELFIPILKNSRTYDIAVGYFTSGWLRDTAEGFAEFALSGGVSRWVVSPELEENDALSIVDGNNDYSILKNPLEKDLISLIFSLQDETRQELCALIAAGVINFRIAMPRNDRGGMLHAKIGIATDTSNNKLAFSGSYNLTAAARANWEHIDVFKSWIAGDVQRINRQEERFNKLWGNDDPSYEVIVPSKSLIHLITREAGPQREAYIEAQASEKSSVNKIELRDYQEQAIKNWVKNNGRGTYVMATGSGKTVTALASIKTLMDIVIVRKKRSLSVVIILPLKHLLDQWFDEARQFGFDPIKCYESSETWRTNLAEQLSSLKVTGKGYVMAMVTNSTFAGKQFQEELKKIKGNLLVVADEAHNLGSSSYLEALPEHANFRLALSATPERYNDKRGTEGLFRYFGEPVIEFTLADAINGGFLCPYEYHPHLCLMSEAEYEEYLELQERIKVQRDADIEKGVESSKYRQLIGERTDLITGVESKLDVLSEQLQIQRSTWGVSHTLVYCGSRKGADERRHIERTVKLLGDIGVKTRKFTSDETTKERREILKLFSSGELDTIAAIKCLDEGVDVPATRVAYILASTANPREFVQRRGRVLRNYQGKDKAIIHDFLVAPPYKRFDEDDMLERELIRAYEFSKLALNADDCRNVLDQLADEYNVREWNR